MTKMIVALALILPLAACMEPDEMDQGQGSVFHVASDRKGFTYEMGTVLYGEETVENTPVARERWLRGWLTENNVCSNGYRITNRDPVYVRMGITGRSVRVTYTGECI